MCSRTSDKCIINKIIVNGGALFTVFRITYTELIILLERLEPKTVNIVYPITPLVFIRHFVISVPGIYKSTLAVISQFNPVAVDFNFINEIFQICLVCRTAVDFRQRNPKGACLFVSFYSSIFIIRAELIGFSFSFFIFQCINQRNT